MGSGVKSGAILAPIQGAPKMRWFAVENQESINNYVAVSPN